MGDESTAAESAMHKLDAFFSGLPPDEQGVIADVVRRAAQQAVEGDEVQGFIIINGFPQALTMNNTPSLFRAMGDDVSAFTTYDKLPRQPGQPG